MDNFPKERKIDESELIIVVVVFLTTVENGSTWHKILNKCLSQNIPDNNISVSHIYIISNLNRYLYKLGLKRVGVC